MWNYFWLSQEDVAEEIAESIYDFVSSLPKPVLEHIDESKGSDHHHHNHGGHNHHDGHAHAHAAYADAYGLGHGWTM